MINSNFQKTDETGGSKRAGDDKDTSSTQNKRQKALPPDVKAQFLPITSKTLIGNSEIYPYPDTLKKFISNLTQYAQNTPSETLSKHISKEDLMKIFDYFIENKEKNPTVKQFAPKIATLLNNHSLILDKKDTGLPRTIKITRSNEWVFDLSVEYMTPPKKFKEFLENCKESQSRMPCQDLLKLISHEDLNKIFDYFTYNTQKNRTIKEFAAKIATLPPNGSLRLDKHKTQLPRTLNVMRSNEGEFLLLVETKSKLSDGTKKALPKIEGAFKSGKPCWRIDSCEMEYFNLVSPLPTDKQRQDVKKEVLISQKFGCDYVDSKQLGEEFEKNGHRKISIYSEKASCGSLNAFFKNKEYKLLTLSQKYALLLDICKGIKAFHDKNHIHQDIKPDNILIKGNPRVGYHAIVTDFGTVKEEGAPCWAIATSGYESPEIASSFKDPDPTDQYYTYFYEYFNDKLFSPTLAQQLLPIQGSHKRPNKANDMWALGVVAYKMLYNEFPVLPDAKTRIENDPLLKGLLEPNRKNRFTIEQAIELLQEMLKPTKILKI